MKAETLSSHLEIEMSAVPDRGDSFQAVVHRGRRRRRIRRAAWASGAVALAFIFVMSPIPYDPNPKAIAGAYDIPGSVEISDLEVAVASQNPQLSDPNIWIGWTHPTPEFDTSNLGPDRSFIAGGPVKGDLGDKVLSGVYLGEYEGEPFYIYAVDPPSIYDRIYEIFSGNFSGEILGTTHGCCSGGEMDLDGGLPGITVTSTSGEEPLIVAEWLGLKPSVSVVAVRIDDRFVGWQTPVGGAISLRLDHGPRAEVTFIAFTADGQEATRHGWPTVHFDAEPLR